MPNKTDLQKFIDLYKSFEIDCIVSEYRDNLIIKLSDNTNSGDKTFTCSTKFDGYCGFFTCIEFSKDGKFITQGFWE